MDWDLFGRNSRRGGSAGWLQQPQQPQQQSDNNDDEVRRLQAEVQRLRSQLMESEALVAQQQEDEDDDDDDEEEPSNKKSHFAAKENPIVMANGFIDGRSNAHAAFSQKCDLLREYKAEFGHCNVPPNPPEKYAKLPNFLMKQRKYYRHVQQNPGSNKITPDRIAMLEEVGYVWPKTIQEKFRDNFKKLKDFKEKFGHTCVQAVESFSDPELLSWTMEQRRNLRNSGSTPKKASAVEAAAGSEEEGGGAANQGGGPNDEEEAEGNAKTGADQQESSNATPGGAEVEATSRGGEENQQQEEKDGDEEYQPPEQKQNQRKKKRKRNPEDYIPASWTDEMRDQLLSLNCPFLSCFEDSPLAKNPTMKGRNLLNTPTWYQRLEQFRAYVAEHGNGFVPIRAQSSNPLARWVREQRRLYDFVEEGKVETCDTYQANFEFLKSLGFVFDREELRKEDERLLNLAAEEAARKRAQETSAGKLEAAKKAEEKAKEDMKTAKEKLEAAKLEIKTAQKALTAAKSAVKQAEVAVKLDPIGKTVRIKPRGDGKPGGLAKVLAVRTTTVLGSELSFYDVEYLENGEKAQHVDGIFVSHVDEGFRMLTVAVEEAMHSAKPPPPTPRQTRSSAKKPAAKSSDMGESQIV